MPGEPLKPKLTEPPAGIVAFQPAFSIVYAMPEWLATVASQMSVIERSQLNESDQLLTAVGWVLVMVIWPPKPLPQSLVTANAAELSSVRSSIGSRARRPKPRRLDAPSRRGRQRSIRIGMDVSTMPNPCCRAADTARGTPAPPVRCGHGRS